LTIAGARVARGAAWYEWGVRQDKNNRAIEEPT